MLLQNPHKEITWTSCEQGRKWPILSLIYHRCVVEITKYTQRVLKCIVYLLMMLY